MKFIYLILGIVMLLAGVAGVLWALGTDSVARAGLLIGAGSVGFVGIVFVFVARYVGGLDGTAILDGVPGTAQVLSVRDTGVTINNLSALIKARVLVTIPGRAPYEAEMRVLLRGRASWGDIQPGMMVPVDHRPAADGRADRDDRWRVGCGPTHRASGRPHRQGVPHVRGSGRWRRAQRVADARTGRQGRLPRVRGGGADPVPPRRTNDGNHRLGSAVSHRRAG
jgi:hypothetical protein